MNKEQFSMDVLDFAVDEAKEISEKIYQDAISLWLAIDSNKISDGDAFVQFRELREELEEAKYD